MTSTDPRPHDLADRMVRPGDAHDGSASDSWRVVVTLPGGWSTVDDGTVVDLRGDLAAGLIHPRR